MATKIENQCKHILGYMPEPPLSDREMLDLIQEAKKKRASGSPGNTPVESVHQPRSMYFLLDRGEVQLDPHRPDVPFVLVGRNTNHKWDCTFIIGDVDEDIVGIIEEIDPRKWVDVNLVPGVATIVQTYYDPEFQPDPASAELLAQTEQLWRTSVSHGTTKQDIFPQDDQEI